MNNLDSTDVKQRHLITFFTLSFLFSWVVWAYMIFFDIPDNLYIWILFLGAFGPTFAAIYLVHRHENSASIKDFWIRTVSITRISWKWYFFIFLIYPAILIFGFFIYSLFGGTSPGADDFIGGLNTAGDYLFLIFMMMLGGPIAEELGWRGYALDPMRKKSGLIYASLLLGLIWIIWHFPLFFVEGSSQNAKGFGIAFYSWCIQLIANSFIFTLVYFNTRRSILSAILLHFFANVLYPPNLESTGEIIFTFVRVAVIVIIIIYWKKTNEVEKLQLKND